MDEVVGLVDRLVAPASAGLIAGHQAFQFVVLNLVLVRLMLPAEETVNHSCSLQ